MRKLTMGKLHICYFIESVDTCLPIKGKREIYDTLDEAVNSMNSMKNRGRLVVREAVGTDVLTAYDDYKPKYIDDILVIGMSCASNWTDSPSELFEYDYDYCVDTDWEHVQ